MLYFTHRSEHHGKVNAECRGIFIANAWRVAKLNFLLGMTQVVPLCVHSLHSRLSYGESKFWMRTGGGRYFLQLLTAQNSITSGVLPTRSNMPRGEKSNNSN